MIAVLLTIRKYSLLRTHEKNELKQERREKERIEDINQMKLQLFTNISHDFRTPLTLIIGPLEQMIKNKMGDNDVQQQHMVMHRNAIVLLQLINQFLDFRKNEFGQLKLQSSKNNIVPFINNIKLSFEELAKAKSINYSIHFTEDKINAWFDNVKLKKIIYNLLSNAFKFTKENGNISIDIAIHDELSHEGERSEFVKIEVRDSGKGISMENIKFIFDRFYQLGQKKSNVLGSGIGLALTKSLVELHKGTIKVESTKGEGSCFTVLLPCGKSHLDKEQMVKDKGKPEKDPNNYTNSYFSIEDQSNQENEEIILDKSLSTILIVEDNSDARSFIKNIFKNAYNVLEAENGKLGIQIAKTKTIDLIISDVMMPVMDGIELCDKIKSNILTSHIPVILLTARAAKESQDSGYKTGANAYITKPFDANILEVRVKNILKSRINLIEKFKKDIILEPKELVATSVDELFLQKAFQIVEQNLSNPEFTIITFTAELNMSRSVLYRKLKALTDQSISEFIRTIKLKKAGQLIVSRTNMNISEIAFDLGFNDLKHFRKSFQKLFNELPSQYRVKNSPSSKKNDSDDFE